MSNMDEIKIRGTLLLDEPLSSHTSWRVGGPVSIFYKPADIDDLKNFVAGLKDDEPLYWVGLGSNLLVRDAGYCGTIICTSGVLGNVQASTETELIVEAGVACPKAAKHAARNSMQGAEFLCGIPGTMGGALAMNAGAFSGETWDIVKDVTVINRHGELVTRTPEEYEVSYRSVKGFADEWFVACTLKLAVGDAEESKKKIKTLLNKRGSSQPTQQPNAGSVFRNPDGKYAAQLIESCGLKGMCIGGACVSDKHANFIINTGTAKASDIENLIEKVAATVFDETEVSLQTEVKIIGEKH